MGWSRCTYRNCSLRTDGKTHMFRYPAADKVRCHQWLANAHKLEFLNLKVSQLKNKVVCQHHFTDDKFMNFKKDKLTFDAVPTENGPYCDSSQLDETKTEQEESKVFSKSLDEKANFSVKTEDFLTNCDLMDLDSLNSLNQINDNNQITIKGLGELAANPIVPKELIPSKKSVKSVQKSVKNVQPVTRRNRGKHYGNSSRVLKDTTQKKHTIMQESQIEYNDYSQRWDVPTQLESQQQNDSEEKMMLDLSTDVNLPDTDINTITAKDQTDPGNNNITRSNLSSNDACTQTLLTEDPENLKVANAYFGMFVARELSNVPQNMRRQIMSEIVRLLELRSF